MALTQYLKMRGLSINEEFLAISLFDLLIK